MAQHPAELHINEPNRPISVFASAVDRWTDPGLDKKENPNVGPGAYDVPIELVSKQMNRE